MNATQETPFNAPVKNCATCAHHFHGKCAKFGFYYTEAAIHGCNFIQWQPKPPKPPRRSLRQWIIDTFWRIE